MPNKQYLQFLEQYPEVSVIRPYKECEWLVGKHLIYIAVPFYHENKAIQQDRINAVVAINNKLISLGYNTLCPISDIPDNKKGDENNMPPDGRTWYDVGLEELQTTTHFLLLALPGIAYTPGVALELGYAIAKQIPIIRVSPILLQNCITETLWNSLYNDNLAAPDYPSITS